MGKRVYTSIKEIKSQIGGTTSRNISKLDDQFTEENGQDAIPRFQIQVYTFKELESVYNCLLQQEVGFNTNIYYGNSRVCIDFEVLQEGVIGLTCNYNKGNIDTAKCFSSFYLLCNQFDINAAC